MTDRRDDDAALDWAIRSADPAFDDWDGLTAWLEADAAHADAYSRAAAGLADVTDVLRHASPVLMAPPLERRWEPARWIAGGALAAAAAGLIGYQQLAPRAERYAIVTAAAETRTVALADGSRIALAGATRLVLDRADPRTATLDRGQALFTIRHDEARPFRLVAGGEPMVDTGTVFDVEIGAGAVTVAVAEGGVRVGEGRAAVDLGPGARVRIADRGASRAVSRVPVAEVGAWASGQISYAGAPVGAVAEAVGRALGVPITVAPDLATRPFSGTLSLAALRRDPAALGPLLGGVMVRQREGWMLRAAR